MDDFEAYDIKKKNYVCRVAGLRSALSSGLSIYGFPCYVASLAMWENQHGVMPFDQRTTWGVI